jgi:transposase
LETDVTRVLVGLDEFEVLDAVEESAELVVTVAVARPEAPCPRCGVFSARVKQYTRQRVRDGVSFARLTVLVWVKRRFRCDTAGCGSFTESTVQVPRRARLTQRLREAVGRAVRTRNVAEVAVEHRLSWWTVWRAVVMVATQALAVRSPLPPERLGLDETTFRRPQRFATGLVDLSSGRLWDLLEGRSKAVVVGRLAELGADAALIADVVIDPFAGYKAAARELVPHARRTADKFHIIRLANAAVTEVRCRRQQDLTGHRGRRGDLFYSARRDLLRARENLTERGWDRLTAAFAADLDLDLECAWVAKEALRDVYEAGDRVDAQVALAEWYEIVEDYDVAELSRLATTVQRWELEILNWFDSRLTNGPTEGRNLIIKAVKRSGFGFRNFHNYRLRVLYRCS